MFVVIGLGNPTYEYEDTRHNFGYLLIDELISRYKVPKKDIITDSQIGVVRTEVNLENNRLILAKPLTYMNNSGLAVKNLLKKFDVSPDNLIVAYDDLDLALEQTRIKKGGSGGGHLGVDSIIENLGSQDFFRLRLGIGRPPKRIDPADFVLEPFKKAELENVQFALTKGVDAIIDLVKFGLKYVMNKYN